jgi:uncharacterized alkaline shock family protein YloU
MTTSAQAAACRPASPAEPVDPATGEAPPAAVTGLPAGIYPPAAAGLDPAERGRTIITRRAVERITARLVDQCPDVESTTRRRLGVPRDDSAAAAWLHGTKAVSLAVRCTVPYPRPVRQSTEALRQLLVTRVEEMTGMRVQRVDVIVTALLSAAGRRVL